MSCLFLCVLRKTQGGGKPFMTLSPPVLGEHPSHRSAEKRAATPLAGGPNPRRALHT